MPMVRGPKRGASPGRVGPRIRFLSLLGPVSRMGQARAGRLGFGSTRERSPIPQDFFVSRCSPALLVRSATRRVEIVKSITSSTNGEMTTDATRTHPLFFSPFGLSPFFGIVKLYKHSDIPAVRCRKTRRRYFFRQMGISRPAEGFVCLSPRPIDFFPLNGPSLSTVRLQPMVLPSRLANLLGFFGRARPVQRRRRILVSLSKVFFRSFRAHVPAAGSMLIGEGTDVSGSGIPKN